MVTAASNPTIASQGVYFDWVVGNALIPPTSPNTGVQKIDRTTVAGKAPAYGEEA